METVLPAIFLVAITALWTYAGYRVGNGRLGRPALGMILGFSLGLIGLLILWALPKRWVAVKAPATSTTAA